MWFFKITLEVFRFMHINIHNASPSFWALWVEVQSHSGHCQQLQRGFAALAELLSLLQLLHHLYHLCSCVCWAQHETAAFFGRSARSQLERQPPAQPSSSVQHLWQLNIGCIHLAAIISEAASNCLRMSQKANERQMNSIKDKGRRRSWIFKTAYMI